MNSRRRAFLGVILFTASLCACTRFPYRPLPPGEVRLMRLEVPETMQVDMDYQAVLSIRAAGVPVVKQACFRWLSEVPSVANSSMYWYNYEASSNEPMGSARSRWLAEGPYYDFSGPVCVEAEGITVIPPNRVNIRFQAKGLKPHYNALECYIEYLMDGQVRESNRVSAQINTSQ